MRTCKHYTVIDKSHTMPRSWAESVAQNRSAFGKSDGRRWACCEGCGYIWTKSDDDRDWHTEGGECTICDLRLAWSEDPWEADRRCRELLEGKANKATQTTKTVTADMSTQTMTPWAWQQPPQHVQTDTADTSKKTRDLAKFKLPVAK